MVRRRARSVLGDDALAHNAAQETFVRFVAYAEHTEVGNIASFLYQSATRVSVERLRARAQQGGTTKQTPQEIRGRECGAWALQDRLALAEVLAVTDLETAQIATMYYLDAMSPAQIAQVMEISRRSVSTHLQRFGERALRLLSDRAPANPTQAAMDRPHEEAVQS